MFGLLERPWFRVLFHFVTMVVLFILEGVVLDSILVACPNFDEVFGWFSAITFIGIFLVILALDVFAELSWDSGFFVFLYWVFLVVGIIIIAGATILLGVFCATYYGSSSLTYYAQKGLSPWALAFVTMGQAFGMTIFFFIKGAVKLGNIWLITFAPLLSIVVSYFLYVILFYIGFSGASFFVQVLPLILGAITGYGVYTTFRDRDY